MEKSYTALRQLPRISLKNAVPLPAPLSIYIEPTNICNFHCHFCPQAFHDYKEKSGGYFSLTPGEFDHIATEIQALGRPQTINFYMLGEPFANKHLLYFIQESKRRNLSHRTILTTNGSLLKPEHHAPLCTSGLDYLRISVYGPDEEVHQRTTGSKTSLSKIRGHIIDLKNYRNRNNHETPYIYVKMVESADADENARFIQAFSDVGDETELEPIMNWNDPVEGSLARLSQTELLKQRNFANKKEVCPSPFYTLVIHADLRVSACCADWNKKTVVGDLKKSSLKQIWTSDELFEFQVKHLQKRRAELPGCSQCTYLHTFPDYLDDLGAAEYIERSRKTPWHNPENAMSQKSDSSVPLTVALMTCNRSAYLKEAIKGILAQTWQDFELLILDNASTDDTPGVVLGIRDERIRYVRNPPGFTAYFNGTSAIQIARGKRIIITHDDDVMYPTLLAKQMAMMDAHPGMTAVWTNTSMIDQAGNIIQAFSTPQGNDRIYGIGEFIARFPQENLLPLPSTLMFERARYPKRLIDQCYYDKYQGKTQPKTHGGDDILIPAMMNTFGPIAFLNEPLLKYRLHGIQDGNRTHLSLGVLNTYRILRRLAGKLPDKQKTLALIESHIARFTTQHEVIHATTRLSGKTRTKLRRLLDSTLSSPVHDSATTIPLLPLRIFLAQHGENITEVFSALAQPSPEHPTAVRALFHWARLRQTGSNLFSPLPERANIVILGSALVSALLIGEARERNLNVLACIDSNVTRQNQTMLGTPIHPPAWLSSQGSAVDYVILSSERDQDAYLHEFIHGLNGNAKTLSWKDLALDQDRWTKQPLRHTSNN